MPGTIKQTGNKRPKRDEENEEQQEFMSEFKCPKCGGPLQIIFDLTEHQYFRLLGTGDMLMVGTETDTIFPILQCVDHDDDLEEYEWHVNHDTRQFAWGPEPEESTEAVDEAGTEAA